MSLPLAQLDRRPGAALWFEIRERLRKAIADGTYVAGEQLPTEAQLMEYFAVSRVTIRTALEHLEREDLIERGSGRGTFVRVPVVEQPVLNLAGFHEDMRARGLTPSTRTLRTELAALPADVQASLKSDQDDGLFIERLLLADGAPMGYQQSWLPAWVLGGGEPFTVGELDSHSLYDLLEERGDARPLRAEEIIEAASATGVVAKMLSVRPGASVLVAHRLCFDRYDRPVEYVDVSYRSDRYRYRVELRADHAAPRESSL